MKNKEYKTRKTVVFIITAVVHAALFQFFMYYKIDLRRSEEEKQITVVKLTAPPLIYRGETPPPRVKRREIPGSQSPGSSKGPKIPAGQQSPPPQTPEPPPATPKEKKAAAPDGKTDNNTPGIPTAPPLRAPDTKNLPSLSANSESIADMLKNYEHRRRGTGGYGGTGGISGGDGTGTGTGGTSRVVFNVRNYDITPWAKRVLLSIEKHWNIPLITKKKADQPLEVVVIISKSGKVASLNVKQSSNADAFDRSALSALRLSQPFPNLPDDFPAQNLEARFVFSHELLAR